MLALLFLAVLCNLTSYSCLDNDDTTSKVVSRNDVITCPTDCSCSPQPTRTISGLSIDCKLRTGNASSLPVEIDALLSALDARLVTSLSIVNSPLTSLPQSVCRLVKLENLVLDGNRLTALPENCFTRMRGLRTLSANNNTIRMLQDGLFDNLPSLVTLGLAYNELSYIGPHVFDVTANLTSLSSIELQANQLTSLDAWPMVRGELVPWSTVILASNKIENFTNEIGWSHRCGQPPVKMTLKLGMNMIRHVMDLADGWNATGQNPLNDILCLLGISGAHSSFMLVLEGKEFQCDCRDYVINSIARRFHFSHWLSGSNCANMGGAKMLNVKLDELICVIDDPLCPPGCSCIKRPYNSTLLVNCPGSKLIDLPLTLPPLNKQRVRYDTREKYEIRFTGSALQRLELRDYLINDTVKLDVSGSVVENLSDDAWLALRNLRHIDLSRNRITTLAHVLQTENDTFSFEVIALHGNPLRCQCEDAWIRTWMLSLGTRLQESDSVQCGSPYWMNGTIIGNIANDKDFCRMDPTIEKLLYGLKIGIPSVAGAAMLVATIVVAFYRNRVYLFLRFNIHPFDVDECTGENMKFDVYLLNFEADQSDSGTLVESLSKDGYLVHDERNPDRDPITLESSMPVVECSKRTIFVISRGFLDDDERLRVFLAVLKLNMKNKRCRMIVVTVEEVSGVIDHVWTRIEETRCQDKKGAELATFDEVKLLMKFGLIMEYKGAVDWWDRLLYRLTVSKLPPTNAIDGVVTARQPCDVPRMQPTDDMDDESQLLHTENDS